jgi:predicted GNAT family N-acyltransferase
MNHIENKKNLENIWQQGVSFAKTTPNKRGYFRILIFKNGVRVGFARLCRPTQESIHVSRLKIYWLNRGKGLGTQLIRGVNYYINSQAKSGTLYNMSFTGRMTKIYENNGWVHDDPIDKRSMLLKKR